MNGPRWLAICSGVSFLVLSGAWITRADDQTAAADDSFQLPVEHPECVFFSGPQERFMDQSVRPRGEPGITTGRHHPAGSPHAGLRAGRQPDVRLRPGAPDRLHRFLHRGRFPGQQHHAGADDDGLGVRPPRDAGFDRPHPGARQRSPALWPTHSANKRAKLIDQLLATPEWVDKWTMYFGDLFQNTVKQAQLRTGPLRAGPQRLLSVDSRFAGQRQAV